MQNKIEKDKKEKEDRKQRKGLLQDRGLRICLRQPSSYAEAERNGKPVSCPPVNRLACKNLNGNFVKIFDFVDRTYRHCYNG